MGRSSRTCLAAVALGLLAAGPAQAETFEVTRFGDPAPGNCGPNDCSLREAVQAANARPGADTILLPNTRKPYKLTIPGDTADDARDGDLDITDELTIKHRGRGKAAIRAIALNDRLFDVFPDSPLRLTKVKLSGGAIPPSNGAGGAIRAVDRVVIKRSSVSGNRTDENGGAIDTNAALVISRSLIANNVADGGQGGALNVEELAPTRIVRSVIRNNESLNSTGGAIRNAEGPLTILRSRLSGNESDGAGGAVRNAGSGDVLIDRSVISGNRTAELGGGLELNDSEIVIRRTTISGNRAPNGGGGIENSTSSADMTITSSTISGNRAGDSGGGIRAIGPGLTVVNSTIAGNRTNEFGGGIYALGGAADVSLNAVSVVRNVANADQMGLAVAAGGGLYRDVPTSAFEVRNSLIALNGQGPNEFAQDCAGDPFDSLGNNLLSTTESCDGFDGPGDRVRTNPKVGELRDNGGPTKTVALKQGSAAIGGAHKPSAPNRDQRGRKRDNDPDIGAFER